MSTYHDSAQQEKCVGDSAVSSDAERNSNRALVDEAQEALKGYVLDPSRYPDHAAGLKTTPGGRYVLIPQPLDTPDDPLNWSPRKKFFILATVAYISFLADYVGSNTIIAVIPQSE